MLISQFELFFQFLGKLFYFRGALYRGFTVFAYQNWNLFGQYQVSYGEDTILSTDGQTDGRTGGNQYTHPELPKIIFGRRNYSCLKIGRKKAICQKKFSAVATLQITAVMWILLQNRAQNCAKPPGVFVFLSRNQRKNCCKTQVFYLLTHLTNSWHLTTLFIRYKSIIRTAFTILIANSVVRNGHIFVLFR